MLFLFSLSFFFISPCNMFNVSFVCFCAWIPHQSVLLHWSLTWYFVHFHFPSDNESEYFSETLAAESLSQYQPSPKHTHHPIVPIQQYSSKQNESIQSQNSQLKHQQQYQSSNVQYPSATQQKYQQPDAHNQHPNNTHHNTTQLNYHSQAAAAYAQQQQQQQQLQQKYYEQYENYARPKPATTSTSSTTPTNHTSHNYNNNTINSVNNNNHTNANSNPNVSLAYNNAHHVGQGYSNNSMAHGNPIQYNSAMNNHVYGGDYSTKLNSNAVPIGAGIGKISDYDPITDGPRNIPNTTRPSSTLIYSSDRGMGRWFLNFCFLTLHFSFFYRLFFHYFTFTGQKLVFH